MYDTEKRVALVKKRLAEHHRRQAQRSIRNLSALCVLLVLSLVGTVGTVQGQPIDVVGMYGAILLHEGAGGYVLVAVISFTVAVVITSLCIKFRKREQKGQDGIHKHSPECYQQESGCITKELKIKSRKSKPQKIKARRIPGISEWEEDKNR